MKTDMPDDTRPMQADQSMRILVELAALFHDLGKASNLFQRKIRKSITENRGIADAVRHEVISALTLAHLFPAEADTPAALGTTLIAIAAEEGRIEAAWEEAAAQCREIHATQNPDADLLT